MCTIKEINDAVSRLSPGDLSEFRAWFDQFDALVWDAQFERDAASGRLDALANEALDDLREGRCTPL
ncbi:MAG: hypothetical protein HUU22_17920 [Phycisphaerae bacterium]|nr:hypothetical protein [Phycisphaerae bacterium]NUQ47899.1 hypothetical protein [Phycisphaerae bacterium]